jgi:hypothetical protein
MSKKIVTFQVTFKVMYKPNGVPTETLLAYLHGMLNRAMGDGLLTGESAAEVEATFRDIRLLPTEPPKKEKKPKGNWTYTKRSKHGQNPRIHEGTVHVCANQVPFYYRLPAKVHFPQETLDNMTEHAEERAKEMITQGYVEGELNYETEKFQATGWWRIDNE